VRVPAPTPLSARRRCRTPEIASALQTVTDRPAKKSRSTERKHQTRPTRHSYLLGFVQGGLTISRSPAAATHSRRECAPKLRGRRRVQPVLDASLLGQLRSGVQQARSVNPRRHCLIAVDKQAWLSVAQLLRFGRQPSSQASHSDQSTRAPGALYQVGSPPSARSSCPSR
jgi:hypothetical protein